MQVANWFEDDGAVAFYSYFTEREDLAMLFERFMMLYRLEAEADVGVFTRATLEDGSFIPTWAQRNRVSDDKVTMRVDYVVSRILPELDVPAIQASLPSPYLLPNDITWRDSASSTNPNEQVGTDTFTVQSSETNAISVSENLLTLMEEFEAATKAHGKRENH